MERTKLLAALLTTTTGVALAAPAGALAAVDSDPAAGAAIDQVVIATAAAIVVTAALLFFGLGHRTGRVALLGRIGDFAERVSGLPGWAAVPSALATGSLLTAVFGMYWDISLHIDQGRDAGPLANPAHYFILAGLFGIFSAGYLAMVMPKGRPSASAIRIAGDWHAPLGGVLIAACGAFSLTGFPLDDIWHRLFGQDVTLFGPTHLMLIGGAAMTLVGLSVLLVEGARATEGAARGPLPWVVRLRALALTGALLIGLSTFQAEFDFGVPQFRFVLEPLMVMVAAGVALVAARVWLGAGAALGAAAFFLAVRGGLALLVGPALGESTPHMPLYLVEAALIELVALRVSPERPLAFGLAAGVAIGTVGLAAEWGWSYIFMPIAWPGELLPEGALFGLGGAVAGSVIGAWVGARLASDRLPRTPSLRLAGAAAALALAALVGLGLQKTADPGVTGRVELATVDPRPERTVEATVHVDPPAAAADADWLNVTAWQGGGLVVDELAQVGPGTYRTTEPIPVNDSWKALVRIHQGDSLLAMPLYMPRDTAIPAKGIPASPGFTREFVADHEVLQREQTTASGWLWAFAYLAVGAIALGFLAALAWGLHRLALAGAAGPTAGRPASRETRPDVGRPVVPAR